MCEWLTNGEWCDVQLQCGGRTFSAHRAVLASVSKFLRQILLTCHEESPTLIVLPDFDLEAVSSVLYYIYNGEVVIQKEKLEMFLEIVKTMQIYVDVQCLPETYNTLLNSEPYYLEQFVNTENKHLYSLGSIEKEQIINIKRSSESKEMPQHQNSVRHLDWGDKQMRHQGFKSSDDLRSWNKDRQRSRLLRDLYIETYPWNGNVNGRSAGVLAMSNECYREPTSVLLTNANGKHLRVDDALLETSKKPSDLPFWDHNLSTSKQMTTKNHSLNAEINLKNLKAPRAPFEKLNSSSNTISQFFPIVPLCFGEKRDQTMRFFDQKPAEININKINKIPGNNNFSSPNILYEADTLPSCRFTKRAILNQVLESPWCPRLPINYSPMQRKEHHLKRSLQIKEKEPGVDDLNDNNNNNVDTGENLSASAVSDPSNVLLPDDCIAGGSDFKCTICNQVFTNTDTLAIHMKRHSSSARYNCSECGKSFSQLRNFKYHMSIHRGTREFAATCTVCGKYFNDRGYLSSHMKIHKNRKEYKCSQCPKSFNQRVAYNMHVRIHTGVKPHVCEQCGKAFSRKMLLKQHQRTHSGERPYTCPHCDKRFADRSNMTLHLRLHTGVKPFSCTLCPKSFTKKHHLKSHLNFHTGAKPYSCPRCKLAFTQSSNMRTHLKKCTVPITVDETISTNN